MINPVDHPVGEAIWIVYYVDGAERMITIKAFEDVADFIAAEINPTSLAQFKASPKARARVGSLIEKEKTVGLTADEKSELDLCMQLEHVMRMAKAKAHSRVAHG